MALFWNIFVKNVLPAFVVVGAGVLLDRKLQVDKKSLSRMAIYVLTPCLVFSSITRSAVDPTQFGLMIAFVIVLTLIMVLLALAVGRLLRWPSAMVDALVLSVAFVNAGNFGLPIMLFAFGEVGLQLGTVFFVATNFTGNTVAAFFANRSNGGGWKAMLRVLRLPGPYAFALAILLRSLQVTPPEIVLKPLALIGQASVPVMLMMLGVQLSQTRAVKRYREIGVGVALRLVVGALVGWGLAPLMGLQGLARSVGIAQAATPTAVTSALMAIEFDADAEYVSSVIFYSTLFSGITLTVVLTLLS